MLLQILNCSAERWAPSRSLQAAAAALPLGLVRRPRLGACCEWSEVCRRGKAHHFWLLNRVWNKICFCCSGGTEFVISLLFRELFLFIFCAFFFLLPSILINMNQVEVILTAWEKKNTVWNKGFHILRQVWCETAQQDWITQKQSRLTKTVFWKYRIIVEV